MGPGNGDERLGLLHDFSDLLQKPIFGARRRRPIAFVARRNVVRDRGKILLNGPMRDGPRWAGDRDRAQGAMVIPDQQFAMAVGPQFRGVAVNRVARKM